MNLQQHQQYGTRQNNHVRRADWVFFWERSLAFGAARGGTITGSSLTFFGVGLRGNHAAATPVVVSVDIFLSKGVQRVFQR